MVVQILVQAIAFRDSDGDVWETVFEVATGIPYVDVGGKKQSNITVWLSKSVPGVAFVFKVTKKVCCMFYPHNHCFP